MAFMKISLKFGKGFRVAFCNERGTREKKVSFIRIEKSPSHNEEKTARLTLPQEAIERTKLGENKQKTKHTHQYEQKCQSHTCSGTINNGMYDSDLTTTSSPLTSSAPYIG
jgi:hypothetical protein